MTAVASVAVDTGSVPADASGWYLVDRARAGERSAFSLLYENHRDLVFGFIMVRTRDRPLAEELTSETFLRAYRRLDSVTHRGSTFGAWLVTIARNLVLDDVKSARRRYEVSMSDDVDEPREPTEPEREVCRRAVRAELLRGMAELTEPQRLCLELRFFERLSVGEVARRMDRSEVSVRALQLRAVRRLADVVPPDLALG